MQILLQVPHLVVWPGNPLVDSKVIQVKLTYGLTGRVWVGTSWPSTSAWIGFDSKIFCLQKKFWPDRTWTIPCILNGQCRQGPTDVCISRSSSRCLLLGSLSTLDAQTTRNNEVNQITLQNKELEERSWFHNSRMRKCSREVFYRTSFPMKFR